MSAAPELRLHGITVRFGDATALDGVDLTVPPGVRLAIVGENGAGKSTLQRVLSGRLRPNGGAVSIDGQQTILRSPRDAAQSGIGLIPQHDDLIAAWSVLDNILLGAEGSRGLLPLDRAGARRRLVALMETSGLSVPPEARVADLSVPARQRATILRALFRGARVLLLDEPTAVLSPGEAEELWAVTRQLSRSGTSIVFVTHRLDDVQRQAQRVFVLRRGRCTLMGSADTDRATLVRAIVGEAEPGAVQSPLTPGDTVLALGAFRARVGEVVGIAGVEGSGQAHWVAQWVGLADAPGLTLGGEPATDWSVARRRNWGLGYIPEDRHRDALADSLSIAENAALGRHRQPDLRRWGILNPRALRRNADALCRTGDVRGATPERKAGALSGGNQQKLVLEREMTRPLRALIACQPTRGLDLTATGRVHDRLRRLATSAAVIVVSYDLDELRAVSDRIVVFYAGRIVGDVPVAAANDTRLGALMTGGE